MNPRHLHAPRCLKPNSPCKCCALFFITVVPCCRFFTVGPVHAASRPQLTSKDSALAEAKAEADERLAAREAQLQKQVRQQQRHCKQHTCLTRTSCSRPHPCLL